MFLLARHKLADYARWKRLLESHVDAQREAGLTPLHVWRGTDDPATAFVLFQVHDRAKAQAFIDAPAVPEVQEAAGVIEWEGWFLSEDGKRA